MAVSSRTAAAHPLTLVPVLLPLYGFLLLAAPSRMASPLVARPATYFCHTVSSPTHREYLLRQPCLTRTYFCCERSFGRSIICGNITARPSTLSLGYFRLCVVEQ
ncbi:hypothetical protein A0H81_01313 [Grifola frondosa]|uniref:Uncharacterized protein n=1 Tax=Grifola frondosa TaxID=5627 RepID=A0A1C7MQ13_GRIFR|nr:hypothetical protein A0H81_01313 [Grifola frondosa]